MTQEQVAVTAEKIRAGKTSLGIEFGSTRIKAVLIDDAYHTIAAGDYEWASHLEDGLWSYTQEEIWKGLQTAYARMAGDVETAYGERLTHVGHIGFSAMMHGYLAFDKSGELLVPFRTWQNTMTGEEAAELTELFGFNIPQRWSIAHLWHAIRTGEAHVGKLAHITTLAGYFHYMLTGVNAVGIGEASGMFPIDSETLDYDRGMMEKFDRLIAEQPFTLRDLLPQVLPAGVPAGKLTAAGADALAESPSAFERWCDNRIIQTISPEKYHAFTIGPVIAYVIARQNEIKTVRFILSGKQNELPDDSIRERAREMYV